MSESDLTEKDMKKFHFLVEIPHLPLPVLVPISHIHRSIKSIKFTNFPSQVPYLEGVMNFEGQLSKVLDLDIFFGGEGSVGNEALVFNVGQEKLIIRNASIKESIFVSDTIATLDLQEISGQNTVTKSLLVKDENQEYFVLSINLKGILDETNKLLSTTFEDKENLDLRTLSLEKHSQSYQEIELFQSTSLDSSDNRSQEFFELRFRVSSYTFAIPLEEVGFLIRDLKLVKSTDVLHQFVIGYIQHQQQLIPIFDPKYLHNPDEESREYSQAIVFYNRSENMFFGCAVDSIETVHEITGHQVVSREVFPMIFATSEFFVDYVSWENEIPVLHINGKSLFRQLMEGKMVNVNISKPYISSKKQGVDEPVSEGLVGEKHQFITTLGDMYISIPRDNFISIIKMQQIFGTNSKWIIYGGKIVPIIPIIKELFDQNLEANCILIYRAGKYTVGIPFIADIHYGTIRWSTITAYNVTKVISNYAERFMSVVAVIGFGRIEGSEEIYDKVAVSVDDGELTRYISARCQSFDERKIKAEERKKAQQLDQASQSAEMESILDETTAFLLFEIGDIQYAIDISYIKGARKEKETTISIESLFQIEQAGDNSAYFEVQIGKRTEVLSFSRFRDIRYFYQEEIEDGSDNPIVKATIHGDKEIFILDLEKLLGEDTNE